MSIATVSCRAQLGLHAPLVQVEVSLGSGLPTFSIVGLPATVVKESKDRVRSAIVNSNFEFPAGRITVNLSPADIPKRGGRFDLPIALGILLASGQLKHPRAHGVDVTNQEFYGELGLAGELRSVPGMLLAAACAARDGHEVVVPLANVDEVRLLLGRVVHNTASHNTRDDEAPRYHRGPPHCHPGAVIRATAHLLALCAHLEGRAPLPVVTPLPYPPRAVSDAAPDLSDVRGQVQAKRALTIAAAGGHHLLMMGPPGAGKSMLAMRLPGLLPPMTDTEALEVAAIFSVSGSGFNASNFGLRPVRAPHHTASAAALIGGGSRARPGEISLAHHGVLFLDELLEYDRRALEALREPLESGVISIARATHHTQYPAQFQLIAAMNPCPCGRHGDATAECRCTPPQIAQYRARVSAPLLERFDIHLEVPRVDVNEFQEPKLSAESSATVAAHVIRAREIQLARQGRCNGRLMDVQIDRVCMPTEAGQAILDRAITSFNFSARTRQRILKVARTIADLSGDTTVGPSHVSEAITYRSFDRLEHKQPYMSEPAMRPIGHARRPR
jgi:magnesium chelatase family protein